MLEHLARGMPRAAGAGGGGEVHREPLELGEVARRTHGFVGADLQRVCQEAAVRSWSAGRAIAPTDFEAALEVVRPSALTADPLYVPEEAGGPGIAGLGGVAAVWEELTTCVLTPLTESRLFAEMHVSPPRGVVLHGPGGCGKTALAHAAAHAAARHARVLNIRCPDIVQALVGASERTIAQIFATARRAAPCVILLDQIDVLAPTRRRGGSSEHTMDRILSALLVEMDGLTSDRPRGARGSDPSNVLVIATTADLTAIDAAMLRPGPCHAAVVLPPPCCTAATADPRRLTRRPLRALSNSFQLRAPGSAHPRRSAGPPRAEGDRRTPPATYASQSGRGRRGAWWADHRGKASPLRVARKEHGRGLRR